MATPSDLLPANRRLIGISNTYSRGAAPLAHAEDHIRAMLRGIGKITLLVYALGDRQAYADLLGAAFQRMGVPRFDSPHNYPGEEQKVLADAEALYIGGGSTPRLVANLHALRQPDGRLLDPAPDAARQSLRDIIRQRAAEGMPVMGASAGFNVMCGDIRTTNDMHITVWQTGGEAHVSRLDALGLLPPHLSVNPHYLEKVELSEETYARVEAIGDPALLYLVGHQGESRADRLNRVLDMDPARVILAVREGAYVVVEGKNMTLQGTTGALVFRHGRSPQEVAAGEDLSDLL